MTICSHEHMFIRTYVVQSVELWTSCGSCGTDGTIGESGEQRGQDRGGAKPLQVSTRGRHSVDPWSTHRPPLGTPRYGEVFLKAAWRGVRPTPLKTPRASGELVPHPNARSTFVDLTKGVRQKFGERSRIPLPGCAPKGSYFASAVAEASHSGAL